MSETKMEMATLKMPTEQMDFIRRNQKLAQQTGKIMVALTNAQSMATQLKKLLTKKDLFKASIENGTEEELEKFLEACIKASETEDHILHFKDVTTENFNQIKEKFGDSIVAIRNDEEVTPG